MKTPQIAPILIRNVIHIYCVWGKWDGAGGNRGCRRILLQARKCCFVLERRDRRHGSEPKVATSKKKHTQRKQTQTFPLKINMFSLSTSPLINDFLVKPSTKVAAETNLWPRSQLYSFVRRRRSTSRSTSTASTPSAARPCWSPSRTRTWRSLSCCWASTSTSAMPCCTQSARRWWVPWSCCWITRSPVAACRWAGLRLEWVEGVFKLEHHWRWAADKVEEGCAWRETWRCLPSLQKTCNYYYYYGNKLHHCVGIFCINIFLFLEYIEDANAISVPKWGKKKHILLNRIWHCTNFHIHNSHTHQKRFTAEICFKPPESWSMRPLAQWPSCPITGETLGSLMNG